MNLNRSRIGKALLLTAALLASSALAGCTATVSLEPATDANNPACAEVSVRLPDELDSNQKRRTNAQATAAWGNPAVVLLRCGIEPVYASTLPCVTAGEVDWLVDATEAPSYRFVSFGRKPAVEVIIDSKKASGVTALEALAPAVSRIEATRQCTAKPAND